MIKKIFQCLLLLIFVALLLAGAAFQTSFLRNSIRDYLVQQVRDKAGLTLEIAQIQLTPSFVLHAQGIKLSENENTIATVSQMHIGLYPLAIWNGYMHFHFLNLEGVRIYNPSKGKPGASLFSIKDLPFKIHADEMKIDDVAIMEHDEKLLTQPAQIEGSFYIDPFEGLIYTPLRIAALAESENWIAAEIAYEKDLGSLHLTTHDGIQLYAEFLPSFDKLLKISRFHVSYASCNLDGNATVSFDGDFKDSSVFFTTGELSEKFPIEGYLYGEGRIEGSIWAPECDFKIFSDQLTLRETVIRNVEAKIISRKRNNKLSGEIMISFLKDEIPYNFSSKLLWNETFGPLPKRLKTTTNLGKLTQMLNIETTDISGDVEIELEFTEDNILGKATLHHGQLESYALGSMITNAEGVITGDLYQLELKQLEAVDTDNGAYSIKGFVLLDPTRNFPFEASIELNQAQILNLDNATAKVSGNLFLQGDILNASLEGSIRSDSAKFTTIENPPGLADNIQITYINHLPSDPPPTPSIIIKPEIPLNLNIKVEVPDNAKIKSGEFTSEWKGDFFITGTPMAPQYFGELSITEGKYSLRGRTLKFNKGTMTLAGELDKKITLYLIGEMEIDRYKIEVIIKGPSRNPVISFRSNPPLARKEILSWLLFNKDISEISEFQGGQLNQSITNLSSGKDEGPDPLTRIGNAIGLDRVGISGGSSGNGGQVSFEVGKYISENTYISLSRKPTGDTGNAKFGSTPIEQDQFDQSNRIGIETSLGKYFKLQAEVDEDQCGQINILWKKDY